MDYKKHIEGLQNNSYKDFRVLYYAYAGNLYGFVFGLVKSNSLAKDIVQETFIKVWTNRRNIDANQSFKSYLFKISQNLVVDNFRKQMANPVFENYLDYSEELFTENDIEQHIDFDMFTKRLEMAKHKLTPRQREIFELNKEQGISVPEIAVRLNIHEQTIYNQLSTAMRLLKKEIGIFGFFFFSLFFN
ncbi:DNA-directed RNA polymerase sigma-70 factor [Bacteroidia bacterium]|nr:DNA-directed RNA polymerase sigma-70 factor [Bacteroidia bacterium]